MTTQSSRRISEAAVGIVTSTAAGTMDNPAAMDYTKTTTPVDEHFVPRINKDISDAVKNSFNNVATTASFKRKRFPPVSRALSCATVATAETIMTSSVEEEEEETNDSGRTEPRSQESDHRQGCLKVVSLLESLAINYKTRNSEERSPKSVSWSTIDVHLHEVCLGDNPSVTRGGPPLSIVWKAYESHCGLVLDDYEAGKTDAQRRRVSQLALPAQDRHEWLDAMGYSRRAQNETMKAGRALRDQWRKTARWAKRWSRLRRAGRRLWRFGKV